MTKITTIIGLSLLAGSTLLAQNTTKGETIEKILYPKEYSERGHFSKNEVQTLTNASITNSSLKAIYPDDTFIYTFNNKNKQNTIVTTSSSISNNVLKAIYPKDAFVYQNNK